MRRILGRDQPHHLPPRIGESRFDGVEAEQEHVVRIGVVGPASRRLLGAAPGTTSLSFWPWSSGHWEGKVSDWDVGESVIR